METTEQNKNNKRPFSIKKLFVEKNIPEWIYFLWEVSPATIKAEFLKYGAELNTDSDIEALIGLYKSGNDKRGIVKTNDNRILIFDTASVIKSINIPIDHLNSKGSNVVWIA